MLINTNQITVIDVYGIPRIIREVSVNNFVKLKELYSIYWGIVLEIDPFLESTFYDLIQNELIKNVAVEIIKLVGLEPELVGVDTLAALVHSYIDAEGTPKKGYIWTKYFERSEQAKTDSGSESLSLEEYRYFLIAALSEGEGGIHNVLPLLDNLSIQELEGYFVQKQRIIKQSNQSDKKAKQERLKKQYKEKFGTKPTFQGVSDEQIKNK